MSWRFRQSFKIIPGLKLNLSKSGLSASIGGAPFTVNMGPRGVYGTASVPGTGVSFRQRLSQKASSYPSINRPREQPTSPNNFQKPRINSSRESDPNMAPVREIRSASTELLTSESLKSLKQFIQATQQEREELSGEVSKADQDNARAAKRFKSWDKGFLLKKIFKKSYAIRRTEAEVASAKASELEEQLRLTTISTQIEIAKGQAEPFFRMRDEFSALSECAAIWDIKAERAVDGFRERTVASKGVSRERIKLSLSRCDLIQWDQEVPHFQNANGGDIFLYPGFILYRASKTAFSVIDFHDVELAAVAIKFHEEEGVPSDSKVVGQTWAKANKDGSRDKRFAGNYQIPIAVYGDLTLKSDTGLLEEFQFSSLERLERFANSWKNFVASFDHQVSLAIDDLTPVESLSAADH